MIVQILAAIIAGFTYVVLMNNKSFALGPQPPYAWYQAIIAEVIYTFVLAFVVLSVATVKSPLSEYFGFAIGACVTVGGNAIGKVSGGSLNPAVSFGIATSGTIGGGAFWPCLAYTAAELVGGCAAAGIFRATHRTTEYAGPE